jgi:hypothetical protein
MVGEQNRQDKWTRTRDNGTMCEWWKGMRDSNRLGMYQKTRQRRRENRHRNRNI